MIIGVCMIMISILAPNTGVVLASVFVELVALDAIRSAACWARLSAEHILAEGMQVFGHAQVTLPQVRMHLNGLVLERLA